MNAERDRTKEPNPNDFRRGHTGLIDLASPQDDYRSLRDTCPVTVSNGIAFFTRYQDIDAALRDPGTFRSKNRGNVGHRRPTVPMDIDPPEHRRHRRILDPMFSPREMTRYEDQFRALTHELIDSFADQDGCDFAADFAVPLPSMMFLRLLGLPPEDLDLLLELKNAVMLPPSEGDVAGHMASMGQRLTDYFEDYLARRGDYRSDDIISRLLDSQSGVDGLTHEEVVDILYMITLAGLDTVTSSLECMIHYLAEHPEQRRLIVEDPSLIPSALEELLRWETPNLMVVRSLPEGVTVGGVELEAGTPVALIIGSANTDEEAFERPEVVDFERAPNRHIAFGKGIHRCLGSHLARIELRIALTEFHRRIPDYELEPGTELVWNGVAIRSVPELPIRFLAPVARTAAHPR